MTYSINYMLTEPIKIRNKLPALQSKSPIDTIRAKPCENTSRFFGNWLSIFRLAYEPPFNVWCPLGTTPMPHSVFYNHAYSRNPPRIYLQSMKCAPVMRPRALRKNGEICEFLKTWKSCFFLVSVLLQNPIWTKSRTPIRLFWYPFYSKISLIQICTYVGCHKYVLIAWVTEWAYKLRFSHRVNHFRIIILIILFMK